MKESQNRSIALNLSPVFLILLILKLTHVVTWSWWIIFLPVWLPVAALIAGVLLFLVVGLFLYSPGW